ncbi:MAG: hypothetical protein AB7S26_26415 [Sandaracinaceae bacterium]
MQRTGWVLAVIAAWLSGCVAAGGAHGELSEDERTRLEGLGIYDVAQVDGSVLLYDEVGVELGHLEMLPSGGFDVVLDGFTASLDYAGDEFTWSCQDGHAATGPARGPGLMTMLGYDATLESGPCARALAAGWVANGVFKAPPEGCARVLHDGVARLECELPDIVGGESALLAACSDPGGGGGGGGGWGDGCTNDGSGCAPECASCSYASGAALCSPGGGGGGGGGAVCSFWNWTRWFQEWNGTSAADACARATQAGTQACHQSSGTLCVGNVGRVVAVTYNDNPDGRNSSCLMQVSCNFSSRY